MTATALAAVSLGGHVLLEGPPGRGQDAARPALSRALGVEFRRVQFTPDMLPSDLTGNVALRGGELVFRRGPVFTNVLLADEINRTPPKTQAALLEAMQERQVSVEGRPEPLPDPFLVVATQNPIEYEGTYALPEAQLDRFLVKLDVGYPGEDEELGDARARAARRRAGRSRRRCSRWSAPTRCARRARRSTPRASTTRSRATWSPSCGARASCRASQLGASPRAAVHLLGAAKAAARLAGRDYVTPDDVGGWRPPCCATGSCSRRRPSSSATARRRGADRARRGAGAAVSVAPRAAAVLAGDRAAHGAASPAVGALRGAACWPAPSLADALARAPPARGRAARAAAPRPRGARRRCASSRARRARARAPAGAARARLEPREADGRLDATVTPRRRGRHTLPPVALRSEGPLGLGRWRHEGAGEQEVTVYPDLPAARRLALAVRQGRFREAGRLTRGPLGLGTDFESIRDYEPDDDIRQVNWRATERMQRPMSNQYRVEQDREVMLLIDAGRLMAAPLGDRTRLDVAVDAAVAVALVADVVGDRSGASPSTARSAAGSRRGGRAGTPSCARCSTSSRAPRTPTTSSPSGPSRAPSAR